MGAAQILWRDMKLWNHIRESALAREAATLPGRTCCAGPGRGDARPSALLSRLLRGAGRERRRGLTRVSSWARALRKPAACGRRRLQFWKRLGRLEFLRAALPGSRAEESEAREVQLPEQPHILPETRLRETEGPNLENH